MWAVKTVTDCVKSVSNYSITNTNNMFNFYIKTMENMSPEQQKTFISDMKILIGMTVFNQFKNYVVAKVPSSEILKVILEK